MQLSRRRGLLTGAAALAVAGGATAQPAWTPGREVDLIAPSEAGSGFDLVARILQKVWQQSKLVTVPVTVVNKPGASGSLGWTYVRDRVGLGTYLAVVSDLIITNHLSGNTPLHYDELTPVAILQKNDIGFLVPAASTIRTGQDFIDRLKQDPASVSIAMSGVGGQNHIALGLIMKAIGADVRKARVVGFTGSSAAQIAVVGNHVDVLIAPLSSVASQLEAGGLRGIGVASEERMKGAMANTPTWREQGVNAVFFNWRGMIGPKGMTPAMLAYWDGIFAKTVQDPAWLESLAREQITSDYLDSTQAAAFLAREEADTRTVLQELGLARSS